MATSVRDLAELLSALGTPARDITFAVARISGSRFWLGKDNLGRPAILIAANDDGSNPVTVELRNIRFEPSCRCRVFDAEQGQSEQRLAVLRCLSEHDSLFEYFLWAVSNLCEELPEVPSVAEVSDAIGGIVELFRALSAPRGRSAQGLWFELFLIAHSSNISAAVAAWHSSPDAVFDFESDEQRLEAKSTTRGIRQHQFRLEQLRPDDDKTTLIVSALLIRSDQGKSITDLWHVIDGHSGISSDHRQKVARVIAATLGDSWQRLGDLAFDETATRADMRFYDQRSIPTVREVDDAVTNVQFVSDLTMVKEVSTDGVRRQGGIFQILV